MIRQINEAGLQLLKSFESCKLTVYKDAGGKLTVGVGHLVLPEDNLKYGDTITQAQADDFLDKDLTVWENFVTNNVKVPLTDNQFAALVSLSFNCGSFPILKGNLGKLLNAGNYEKAAEHIILYNEADGLVLDGLTRRRKAEMELFLK